MRLYKPLLCLFLLAAPARALAEEEGGGGLSFEAEAGVVSDYRYRGVSLSGERPAVQGGVTAYGPAGFYAGVWASSIEEYGIGPDGDGARAELDFSLGRSFSVGAWEVDLAASAYTYPDGDGVNYVEFPVSASRTAGAWTWTVGGAVSPPQTGNGDETNTYLFGAAEWAWPERPVTLTASIGREDGAWYDGKLDWSAGARFDLGKANISLTYVDADGRYARGGLVAAVGVKFGG
jgi:uncharacterized protein (TIGR02001 family)